MLLTCSNRAGGVSGGLRSPALHQRACRGSPFGGTPYLASPALVAPCRVARGARTGDAAALRAREEAELTSRNEELLAANAALTAALAAKWKVVAPSPHQTGAPKAARSRRVPQWRSGAAGPPRVCPEPDERDEAMLRQQDARLQLERLAQQRAQLEQMTKQLAQRAKQEVDMPWWRAIRFRRGGAGFPVFMEKPVYFSLLYAVTIGALIHFPPFYGPIAFAVVIPMGYAMICHLLYSLA
ncbi:hypothetical protein ACK3TF_006235 [Chlorella vulgaris]